MLVVSVMRLYQIPFSHNCIKVRHVLDLKRIPYETVDIVPIDRRQVIAASKQWLVPALVDDGHAVAGSTPILLYLEERFPEPQLLPVDPVDRAECLMLMDWADEAFMALTRRLAYAQVLSQRGQLGRLFFPSASPRAQRAGEVVATGILRARFGISERRTRRDVPAAHRAARIAVDRLGGNQHLVGDTLTLADITLATMCAPLQYAPPEASGHPAVSQLLAWAATILQHDFTPIPSDALAA
jgi:glutathione S-transferase